MSRTILSNEETASSSNPSASASAPTSGVEPSAAERYLPLLLECNRLIYDVPAGTRGAAISLRAALDRLAADAAPEGWALLESAPRDATWFEATDGLAVRRVRFTDRYDRLPTGEDRVWQSYPWLWRPISAPAIAAAEPPAPGVAAEGGAPMAGSGSSSSSNPLPQEAL